MFLKKINWPKFDDWVDEKLWDCKERYYLACSSDVNELVRDVNEKMVDGFDTIGGICFGEGKFYQAMIGGCD